MILKGKDGALTFGSRDVASGWRWRDASGQLWAPEQMVTRHLFFTFRMIWNNHMPPEARVGNVRLYRFGPDHNRDYLAVAVVALGRELFRRNDLTPEWAAQLRSMANWFATFSKPSEARLGRTRPALEARR